MQSSFLIIFVLLSICINGQNNFIFPEEDDIRPQFSFTYSDAWVVTEESRSTISLAIDDPRISKIPLKLVISGKVYHYDGAGFAMENAALVLFNTSSSSLDTIIINGKRGYRLESKNIYKNEERTIQDIFVDFIQYSSISIHLSGASTMFQKYQEEIDQIIASIILKEVRIIPPVIEIGKEDFESGMKSGVQSYITESIINPLFLKSQIIIEGESPIEYLTDFFKWKRQSKYALAKFDANNLLLNIEWSAFTKVDIQQENSYLQLSFFVNDSNILTLETALEEPIVLNNTGLCDLSTFYIDYRPRSVIVNGKFLLNPSTNRPIQSPYMLLNGEVFPLNYKDLVWY